MEGLKKSLGNHYHGLLPCSLGEEVPLPSSILHASWGAEGGAWMERIGGVQGSGFFLVRPPPLVSLANLSGFERVEWGPDERK